MCKRCENSWDAVQSFWQETWTDGTQETQEAFNAACSKEANYITEHSVIQPWDCAYLLCEDGSLIRFYDGEFSKNRKSGFNYCPYCGRKLG